MKIVGVGHYAPARVVTNDDFEAWLDTSDEWITSRTGMKRRHWASDDEATSDLASAAAQAALGSRRICPPPTSTASSSPPSRPTTTFPRPPAWSPRAWASARRPLSTSRSLAAALSTDYGRLGADPFGRLSARHGDRRRNALENYRQRGSLDRDSLRRRRGRGDPRKLAKRIRFLASELGADGSRPDLLFAHGSGLRKPLDHAALDAKVHLIHMEGREMFRLAVTKMIESTDAASPRQT